MFAMLLLTKTLKRNERAVHLYRKFEFDIEGTKKRGARTKNGEFLDVYLMAKLID